MTESRERIFAPTEIVVHGNGMVLIHKDGKITGVDTVSFARGVLTINRDAGGSTGVVMSSSSSFGCTTNFMSIGNVTMGGNQVNIDGVQISTAKGGTELHVKSSRLKYVVLNGRRLATTSSSAESVQESPLPPRVRLDLERTNIEAITLNHSVIVSIETTKVLSPDSLVVSTNGSSGLKLPRGMCVRTLAVSTNGSSDFFGRGVTCSGPVNLTSNGSSDIKDVTALVGGIASANGSSDIKVNSDARVRKSRGGTASIRVSPISG